MVVYKFAVLAFALGVGLSILTCGCARPIVIDTPARVPVGDAGDDCARACEVLAANSCPAGLNSACADVCRNDQAQGVASMLDPGCVIDAGTVSALVACGVSCP